MVKMLSNVLLSFIQPKAWQIDLTCMRNWPYTFTSKKQPEKAIQTRDFVSGLHINCLSNSPNTLSCLDQAMQTRQTFSIAVKIVLYLVDKMSLVLCDWYTDEVAGSPLYCSIMLPPNWFKV